ncbi:hypothetical protein HELRODRAFT_160199 [Helobdella robusta]|uniref:Uncharacterized protein n=1 Tax=Helobdella robusta TaxID=6412 RepID=T1EPY6_HELRO|nr:hypothetical protein HELRODRAFT_160199 [Helobdella robusta]ESO06069.1 hypothetical protein HELRODRAFT_160199 [Helobdella robusta]
MEIKRVHERLSLSEGCGIRVGMNDERAMENLQFTGELMQRTTNISMLATHVNRLQEEAECAGTQKKFHRENNEVLKIIKVASETNVGSDKNMHVIRATFDRITSLYLKIDANLLANCVQPGNKHNVIHINITYHLKSYHMVSEIFTQKKSGSCFTTKSTFYSAGTPHHIPSTDATSNQLTLH